MQLVRVEISHTGCELNQIVPNCCVVASDQVPHNCINCIGMHVAIS